jgi:alpha-mannosidase
MNVHTGHCAVRCGQGDWLAGGVLAEAEDLNVPLLGTEKDGAKPGTWRAVTADGLPLALGTLKAAENSSGLVLRAYEPAGSHGAARLAFASGWHVTSEMNLLEETVGPPSFTFSPHQIRTWLAEPVQL